MEDGTRNAVTVPRAQPNNDLPYMASKLQLVYPKPTWSRCWQQAPQGSQSAESHGQYLHLPKEHRNVSTLTCCHYAILRVAHFAYAYCRQRSDLMHTFG